MKHLLKSLIFYVLIAAILLSSASPVFAESKVKCRITVNGESVNWKIEPFMAYGPLGNTLILIPTECLFPALGYTVIYDSKLNRSVFTAGKDSNYISFYIDIKTGQIVKEGEEIRKKGLNQVYLVNNYLYICISDLENMAKTFLNNDMIKVDYKYVYSADENYIIKYINYFTIQYNLSSLTIKIAEKYPNRPFVGEQYTKYNTGDWVSGTEIKNNFDELTKKSIWDGFDDLRFYTGKGEQNELTGKGTWNSKSYSIAWELMDAVAEEINKLRKKDGLAELSIDHSLCFTFVGTSDPKINSVFDNAIRNIEINKAYHTYNGKTKYYECMAAGSIRGERNPVTQTYNNSTKVIAGNIVNQWYRSAKGHKEILMNKKVTTMGVLVIITDTRATDIYAVFK